MKKFISLLLCVVTVLPLLSCLTFNVYSAEDEKKYPPDDFKTWVQFDDRWATYQYAGPGSDTIRKSGCMITSIAILIAYSDPSKRDWTVFSPMTCARDNLDLGPGGLETWYVHDLAGGNNFLYLECVEFSSLDGAKENIRKHMNAGEYSMMYVRGPSYSHFSPVVGWNKETDEPIIWDVGSNISRNQVCEPGCCWNTSFRNKGTSFKVVSYKSLISSSLDTIYNDSFDPSTDISDDRLSELNRMYSEWELTGMPESFALVSDQIDLVPAGVGSWDWYLQMNNAVIGEAIQQNNKTFFDYLRAAFVFVGILLIVYAVLLIAGHAIDNTNSFIDINLVTLLSFGKLKVWNEEITDKKKKEGYVSVTGFYIRVSVIALVGILFVSGAVSMFAYKLYTMLA